MNDPRTPREWKQYFREQRAVMEEVEDVPAKKSTFAFTGIWVFVIVTIIINIGLLVFHVREIENRIQVLEKMEKRK